MRASGCAVTAALEGSRPLLCEVQAIATPAASSSPAAFGGGAGGFGGGVGKRANLPISRSDLFVNVVGTHGERMSCIRDTRIGFRERRIPSSC